MAEVSDEQLKQRWEECQTEAAAESQHEAKVAASLALYNYLHTDDLLRAAIETARLRDMPEVLEGLRRIEWILMQHHRHVDVICTRQQCVVASGLA